MRVMVVGRPSRVRGYVVQVLRDARHTVAAVDTPDRAAHLLHTVEWDAVVTDVHLADEAQRDLVLGLPRYVPECRVLLIRGTMRDLLWTEDGVVPIRAEPMTWRDAYWEMGIA